jgi:hypothetical protein
MPIVTAYYNIYNYLYNEAMSTMKIDTVYFFENNPTGYLELFVNDKSHYNGVVVWKYSRSKKTFFLNKCLHDLHDTKHLPILSASLNNGIDIINLDDYINDIHIELSNYGYPSLQHIIEVWSYKTKIILDRTKSWKLNYMDNELNEFSLDIFKETWNFDKINKN